jgi:plasmid stabilization system protein ParE
MTYYVRFSESAERNLAEVVTWYHEQSPQLASDFEQQTRITFTMLREHPLGYTFLRNPVRRVNLRVFPYSIFYEVNGKEILVLAILHQSRYPQFGQH